MNTIKQRSLARRALTPWFVAAAMGLMCLHASPSFAQLVNSLGDEDINDGNCSIREAIHAANTSAPYHGCAAGSYNGTIFLPYGTIVVHSTLPEINQVVTVQGRGYGNTIIDGQNLAQIQPWPLNSDFANLADLTLQNFHQGAVVSTGGTGGLTYVKILNSGNENASGGGAAAEGGDLFVTNSQFESCNAHKGAALYAFNGGIFVSHSTMLKNLSDHGVITADDPTAIIIVDSSTIGGNLTSADAVVLANFGTIQIHSSTIAYNWYNKTTSPTNEFSGGPATSLAAYDGGTIQVEGSFIFGSEAYSNGTWTPAVNSDCHSSGGGPGNVAPGTIQSLGYNVFRDRSYYRGVNCAGGGPSDVFVAGDAGLQPLPGTEPGFGGLMYSNLPRAAGGLGRVYLPATSSPGLHRVTDLNECQRGGDERMISRSKFGNCDSGAVQESPALLVVGNTTLSSGDKVLNSQLVALGYTVSVVGDAASRSTNAQGKAIVVISESVNPSNVTTKFRDVSAGVLVLESGLFDDMNMTTTANLGTLNDSRVLMVSGQINSAIGTLPSSAVAVTTSAVALAWGKPPATVHTDAWGVLDYSQKLIFSYAPTQTMVNNLPAPGARAAFFASDAAAAKLNATGQRLFQETALVADQ